MYFNSVGKEGATWGEMSSRGDEEYKCDVFTYVLCHYIHDFCKYIVNYSVVAPGIYREWNGTLRVPLIRFESPLTHILTL